eukprot:gene36030-42757_t
MTKQRESEKKFTQDSWTAGRTDSPPARQTHQLTTVPESPKSQRCPAKDPLVSFLITDPRPPRENIPTSKPPSSANAASSVTPPEVSEVINSVKRIANDLRDNADNQKKLKAIKGNEERLHRINEVMVEIDLQSSKIVAAIKINKNVLQDLTMLKDVMEEIQEFFVA